VVTYLVGGALGAVAVMATSGTSSEDPFGIILDYGLIGAILILFLIGWIVPKKTVDQKDAEILRLQHLFTDEVIPMVKTYTETMTKVTSNLEESTEALRTLADIQRERIAKGSGL